MSRRPALVAREPRDAYELVQLLKVRAESFRQSWMAAYCDFGPDGLELDGYDGYSRHLGLFLEGDGEGVDRPIGYCRAIGPQPVPETLARLGERGLEGRVAPRPRVARRPVRPESVSRVGWSLHAISGAPTGLSPVVPASLAPARCALRLLISRSTRRLSRRLPAFEDFFADRPSSFEAHAPLVELSRIALLPMYQGHRVARFLLDVAAAWGLVHGKEAFVFRCATKDEKVYVDTFAATRIPDSGEVRRSPRAGSSRRRPPTPSADSSCRRTL